MYRILIAALAVPVSLAHAADAPTVGFVDAGKPFCYARSYDAAHMKAHPKQQVTGLAVSYIPSVEDNGEQVPMWTTDAEGKTRIVYSIILTKTGAGEELGNMGTCFAETAADTLTCQMDGDGGTFSLKKQADGKVMLGNPNYFVVISNEAQDPEMEYVHIEAKDDHAEFLLEASKGGLCEGS